MNHGTTRVASNPRPPIIEQYKVFSRCTRGRWRHNGVSNRRSKSVSLGSQTHCGLKAIKECGVDGLSELRLQQVQQHDDTVRYGRVPGWDHCGFVGIDTAQPNGLMGFGHSTLRLEGMVGKFYRAAWACRPTLPLANFTAAHRHTAFDASGKLLQVA
ncbi:hypothetical protein LXL04_019454 [Taraxacum kok-saghyz]